MSADRKPFHNPFAALQPLRETMPDPPATLPDGQPDAPEAPARSYPRAVVRLERARRGGKDVTVIDRLELSAPERDEWLRAFKAALGCGGSVEADRLVLQGDQRQRVRELLLRRGVKKITVA